MQLLAPTDFVETQPHFRLVTKTITFCSNELTGVINLYQQKKTSVFIDWDDAIIQSVKQFDGRGHVIAGVHSQFISDDAEKVQTTGG